MIVHNHALLNLTPVGIPVLTALFHMFKLVYRTIWCCGGQGIKGLLLNGIKLKFCCCSTKKNKTIKQKTILQAGLERKGSNVYNYVSSNSSTKNLTWLVTVSCSAKNAHANTLTKFTISTMCCVLDSYKLNVPYYFTRSISYVIATMRIPPRITRLTTT